MNVIFTNRASQNLDALISQVNESSIPVSIIGDDGSGAVLVSQDDWNAMLETLHLSSIPSLKESLREVDADNSSQWRSYSEDETW